MEFAYRGHPEALYYHIASDAINCAVQERDEFRLAQYVCTSMVFSALTLESYINQQFAAHVQTTQLNLRKLDIKNKWLKLPMLLGGDKTFDRGSEPFRTFEQLVFLRNEVLMHFKPGLSLDAESDKPTKRPFADVVKDLAKAQLYFQCIPVMINTLRELTGGKTDVPEGFLNGARYLSTIMVNSQMPSDTTRDQTSVS
jgi:hypothetical protein